jgi:predicted ATPase
MYTSLQLADVLHQLMRRPNHHYTPGLVGKLSGVPKATIVNWLDGQVKKPRRWQDLVKVADALRLSMADATRLLQAAGYPSVDALLARAESAEDRALLAAWGAADVPAAYVARTRQPTRLPAPRDSFVGRVGELAALQALLRRPDMRMLTLTGPGGSGKTRLALHLAAAESSMFEHGVYFVSLAPISDPTVVAVAIGQSLGIAEITGEPLVKCLREELGDKQVLLVLDNFEHLVGAAPLIAELLAAAPRLKVVITSRLALRLQGEHIFTVPPLQLPRCVSVGQPWPALDANCVAALARYPAIALFVQRAQAVNPDFALTSANVLAVAGICVRLDGLPLAIELAAARSKVLDPFALLERLESTHDRARLQILSHGPRDLPAHQQTLEATLTWSYDLLDTAARRLFRRWAVFAGGATVEAAEAIASELKIENEQLRKGEDQARFPMLNHAQGTQFSMLNSLETLVDHSLLLSQADTGGAQRFAMLETIREYALDRLEASGELADLRRRHARYYLALAERAESELQGSRQVAWLARLEVEHANMRAALAWFAAFDAASGLTLANALHTFWWVRCHLAEGRGWLERMLAQVAAPTLLRASALGGAGMLAYRQSDYAAAYAFHTESLAIRRVFGDRAGMAASLGALGQVAIHRGDYAQAQALFEESLELSQKVGDQRRIAGAYRALGLVAAQQCDYERAVVHHSASLTIVRNLDDRHGIAITLGHLGDVARCCDDYTRAAQLYDESLPLFREVGDLHGIAWGLHNLGHVALAAGDSALATTHFKASLVICRDLGAKVGIAYGIAGFAGVAVVRGELQRAAHLLAAVEVLLETIHGRMNAADRAAYERNVTTVRAELAQRSCEVAWAHGRALTIERAIVHALGERS